MLNKGMTEYNDYKGKDDGVIEKYAGDKEYQQKLGEALLKAQDPDGKLNMTKFANLKV